MQINYHHTTEILQALNAPAGGPFAQPEWFALLAANEEAALFAHCADGARRLILPLCRRNGRLEALTNWYSFTWTPSGDYSPAIIDALAADLKTQTHRITLSPLPDEDGTATGLEQAFTRAGWSVTRAHCDHNHILPVGGRSFAEYWAQRPGRMRTTLKRKAKKVEISILDRFDETAWAAYRAIYAQSWKPSEGDPDLLEAFARRESAAGHLRLGLAWYQEKPVAAQFWTAEGAAAYIHKLAHLEDMKHLSAGTTLSAALFEHVIDKDRVDTVDFGTGNDPYKRDWMEQDRPRYMLDCLDPRQIRAWPALVKKKILQE